MLSIRVLLRHLIKFFSGPFEIPFILCGEYSMLPSCFKEFASVTTVEKNCPLLSHAIVMSGVRKIDMVVP